MKTSKILLIAAVLLTLSSCKKGTDSGIGAQCSAATVASYQQVLSAANRYNSNSSAEAMGSIYSACVSFKVQIANSSCTATNATGANYEINLAAVNGYCPAGNSGSGGNGRGGRRHQKQFVMKIRDSRTLNAHLRAHSESIVNGQSVPANTVRNGAPTCYLMTSDISLRFYKGNRFTVDINSNTATEITMIALNDTLQIRCTRAADSSGRDWSDGQVSRVFGDIVEIKGNF